MPELLPPEKWEKTKWENLPHKFGMICILKGTIKRLSMLSEANQNLYESNTLDDLLGAIMEDAYAEVEWSPRPDLPHELTQDPTTEIHLCVYDCGLFHTAHREFDSDGTIIEPLIHGFWNNPWMAFSVGDVVMVVHDPSGAGTVPLKERLIIVGHSDYDGTVGPDNDFTVPATCGAEGFLRIGDADSSKYLTQHNGYLNLFDVDGKVPDSDNWRPIHDYSGWFSIYKVCSFALQKYHSGRLIVFAGGINGSGIYRQPTYGKPPVMFFSVSDIYSELFSISPRLWGVDNVSGAESYYEKRSLDQSVESECIGYERSFSSFPRADDNNTFSLDASGCSISQYMAIARIATIDGVQNFGNKVICSPLLDDDDVILGISLSLELDNNVGTTGTHIGNYYRHIVLNGEPLLGFDLFRNSNNSGSINSSGVVFSTNGLSLRFNSIGTVSYSMNGVGYGDSSLTQVPPMVTGESTGAYHAETVYELFDGIDSIPIGATGSIFTKNDSLDNMFDRDDSASYQEKACAFISVDLDIGFVAWVQYNWNCSMRYVDLPEPFESGSELVINYTLFVHINGNTVPIETSTKSVPFAEWADKSRYLGACQTPCFVDPYWSGSPYAGNPCAAIDIIDIDSNPYTTINENFGHNFAGINTLSVIPTIAINNFFPYEICFSDLSPRIHITGLTYKPLSISTNRKFGLFTFDKLDESGNKWNVLFTDNGIIDTEFDPDNFGTDNCSFVQIP